MVQMDWQHRLRSRIDSTVHHPSVHAGRPDRYSCPLACQAIIEAFAELTGISTRALFGLCASSYVILSIPQCLNLLNSCMVYNV